MTSQPSEHRAPRRRRSILTVVAAVILLLLSLLALFGGMDEDGMHPATALFSLALAAAAVGLVWGGRGGYWFGLVVAVVLVVVVARSIARDGLDATGAVTGVLGAAPLLLLLPPAARRRFRQRDAAPSEAYPEAHTEPAGTTGGALAGDSTPAASTTGEDEGAGRAGGTVGVGTGADDAWPDGWTKPVAGGWVTFGLMMIVSIVLTVFGLGMLVGAAGPDRWLAAAVALFGLGCLAAAPLFRPLTRRGDARVATEAVDLGDRQEIGPAFPYSRWRMVAAFLGAAALGLAMLMACLGEVLSGGRSWAMLLLGFLGGFVLVVVVHQGVRKGLGRRWRVVLTPSAVVFAQGDALTVVPWRVIDAVQAFEVSTYHRGARSHEPFIGLVVSDRDAVTTSRFDRALMAPNRALGGDVSLPVRPLAVDPRLLYAALRRHHEEHQRAGGASGPA